VFSVCRRRSVTERPLPQPLPRREGEWSPRYPYKKKIGFVLSLNSIYDSFNALWYLYAGGVLWVRNCAQMSSVKSVWSVREKSPQRVSKMFFFSQKNTEEQNTQGFTETLSQPISQSVTANVSWKASVNSVCRRPSVGSKCAPKCSVNSVRSVRDKTPHCEYPTIFLSQKITEEQNTQRAER